MMVMLVVMIMLVIVMLVMLLVMLFKETHKIICKLTFKGILLVIVGDVVQGNTQMNNQTKTLA